MSLNLAGPLRTSSRLEGFFSSFFLASVAAGFASFFFASAAAAGNARASARAAIRNTFIVSPSEGKAGGPYTFSVWDEKSGKQVEHARSAVGLRRVEAQPDLYPNPVGKHTYD